MMIDIKHFLSEFGSLIFDEHLDVILGFQRKYSYMNSNNGITFSHICSCYGDVTDTCSCFYYRKEKEKVTGLIERYYKLSRHFTTSRNIGVHKDKILRSPDQILRCEEMNE